MEQVFFINPVAGKRDASAELVPQIQAAARQLQLPQPQIVVSMPVRLAKQPAGMRHPVPRWRCMPAVEMER